MKPFIALLLVALAVSPAAADFMTPRVSPKASVMQTVGLTDVTVTYSRPGVKGRVIWGDLVPYDKPWRTGANEATSITVSRDVTLQGQPLPAGTYSLFTIPTANAWTVVFNKEKDLWGAYEYKPEQDALRVQANPVAVEHEEWMRFTFENLSIEGADLVLRWEKLALPIRIGTNDVRETLDSARVAVAAAKPDDWRTVYRAADFLFANSIEPDLAARWAQRSFTIKPTYQNLSLIARMRAKQGKTRDAIGYAKRAIATAKASQDPPDTAPMVKLVADLEKAD